MISNFLEEEKPIEFEEDKVRRYIAGHVCHKIRNEVKGKMITFKPKKKVNPYNIFVQEELEKLNQVNDKKFSIKDKEKMNDIHTAYEALMKYDANERDRLIARADYESQDLKLMAMNIKQHTVLLRRLYVTQMLRNEGSRSAYLPKRFGPIAS